MIPHCFGLHGFILSHLFLCGINGHHVQSTTLRSPHSDSFGFALDCRAGGILACEGSVFSLQQLSTLPLTLMAMEG